MGFLWAPAGILAGLAGFVGDGIALVRLAGELGKSPRRGPGRRSVAQAFPPLTKRGPVVYYPLHDTTSQEFSAWNCGRQKKLPDTSS